MVDQASHEVRMEKRVSVTSTFVSMVIALAFSEMVLSVKEEGFTLGTSLLGTVFFLTAMRVWIGNELYLREPHVVSAIGKMWLLDFMVIVVESIIFVFLATTCSEIASRNARVGFVEILLILYALDVLWVLSMWPRRSRNKDKNVPWWWLGQNLSLIILIWLPGWWAGDFYSPGMLIWLTVTHVVAFGHSVILYDFSKLLD